jgi:hypothetical protein
MDESRAGTIHVIEERTGEHNIGRHATFHNRIAEGSVGCINEDLKMPESVGGMSFLDIVWSRAKSYLTEST